MAAEDKLRESLKELDGVKAALDEQAIVAITDPRGEITGRKSDAEKMRWLASFPERNPIPIIELDLITGVIHYLNPAAARLFPDLEKLGLEHLYLAGIQAVAEPLQNQHAQAARREVCVAGRHYAQTISCGLDQGSLRVYGADITELKQAEDEIRALNTELEARVAKRTAELEAANQELEAFSYSISHDLRAPLRAINGFAGIVLDDFGSQLPAEARGFLERVCNGGRKMNELIDDLLAFSKLSRQPLNRQNVNMSQLAEEALAETKSLGTGRKLETQVNELPPCHGDPALLKRVWVNLLSNALKYSRDRAPAVVEVGCLRNNGHAVYLVRDNGVGFDMHYAQKLFGVFQRLHRADEFEGAGVGLAIVQRIIHRHGGRIWADAKTDLGATFYFTLDE
jgi:signal transduction histidine kinase